MNHREDNKKNKTKIIIIKKKKLQDRQNNFHAWKIAYADFMTALMSFFLLMWIIHAIGDKSRIALESYFNPFKMTNLDVSPHGLHENVKFSNNHYKNQVVKNIKGEVFPNDSRRNKKNQILSITNNDIKNDKFPTISETVSSDGHLVNKRDNNSSTIDNVKHDFLTGRYIKNNILEDNLKLPKNREDVFQFRREKHVQDLQNKIKANLRGLVADDILKGIVFKSTRTGVSISIIDQGNYSMFEKGSSIPLNSTIMVIKKIAEALSQGNEKISIHGHTDSHKYSHSTGNNWKLSLDRAYNAYNIMREAGISEKRILIIAGFADHHLKILSDPMNAANRRIEILVQEDRNNTI